MKISKDADGIVLDGEFRLTFSRQPYKGSHAFLIDKSASESIGAIQNFWICNLSQKTKIGRFIEGAKHLWKYC